MEVILYHRLTDAVCRNLKWIYKVKVHGILQNCITIH